MNKPYNEKKISNNIFIREFSSNSYSAELVWHRDKEDRIIEPIGDNDWFIQIDNELPKRINEKIFIKKETFHRVIKGSDNLKIKLTKLF